ncbi:MAG: 4-hydroxythreonine-4-phosphate dehydrogenase PdxA [Muribaculaceae bacterium]|nr:4-hydroxythreonine-4-phosphate dehydrogenase PdxA [Muribaculaceae bacterium]MBQ7205373.1 4-hydroxythreonine-4-phosphate dehydrogenase PdxA [Muribaculaceae bacterium]
MSENNKRLRVGITLGDTNGIGIEVALKAVGVPEMMDMCIPVMYGSSKIVSYHRNACNLPGFQINHTKSAQYLKENMPNLVECISQEIKVELGQPSKQAGQASFQALEAAVRDLKAGLIDVLVTAPISKDNIQSDQFHFPGHTEYLESAAGEGSKALMVMCTGNLRIALVTMHMPLSQVPGALTVEGIRQRLLQFNTTLKRDFGIDGPRIAVLSLNPHAGENGILGTEEHDIILPAIQKSLDEDGVQCFGPYAADGFFGARHYRRFDGVLAMYHDQGLAPFKTIAMDEGVNFTAGLPIVRTSPDHGTGYDIAGQGIANESSMRHAIYTAIDVYRSRMRYDEMHQNPLPKLFQDRGRDNVKLDLTKGE